MLAPPAIPKLTAVVHKLHSPLSHSHFDRFQLRNPGIKVQNCVVQYDSHVAIEHLKCGYLLRYAVTVKYIPSFNDNAKESKIHHCFLLITC